MGNLEIIVLDRTKAGKVLLSQSRRESITHIISIHNPEGGPKSYCSPAYGFFHHPAKKLRLSFDDIVAFEAGSVAPTEDDVRSVLNFSEIIKKDLEIGDCKILIHCYAGKSRSTAAALILLCYLRGPGYESECFNEIKRIRSIADPNPLMVLFADRQLNRNGAMMKTLDQINTIHQYTW